MAGCFSYDAIFMDCNMPGGYTAARQIRSRQRLQARIPIVALTSCAIAGARE
jgi:CheY-like chemotaxis protein